MKRLWLYFTYFAPIGIFFLLFSKIGITGVKSVFKEINPYFLILGIVLSVFGNLFLSAEKWRQILKSLGLNIPFKKLFLIHTGSIPIKTISPMKSGMLLRAVYLNKNYNLPLLKGTYSLFLTMFLNFFAVIFFILVASFISGIDSKRYVYLSLTVFSACLLVYWILRRESIRKIIKAYFNLWGGKFAVSAEDLYESIKISASRLVIPFAYAVFLVFFELLNFKILGSALGLTIPFLTVLLFASLTILIGNLPVTIHGLGTREAAVCFFFSAYGSPEKLLSLGITVSLVEYFLPVVIGLFLTKSFLVRLSGQ